jgi:hypothetical protein
MIGRNAKLCQESKDGMLCEGVSLPQKGARSIRITDNELDLSQCTDISKAKIQEFIVETTADLEPEEKSPQDYEDELFSSVEYLRQEKPNVLLCIQLSIALVRFF